MSGDIIAMKLKELESLGHKKSNLHVFTSLDVVVSEDVQIVLNLSHGQMQSEAKTLLKKQRLACQSSKSGDVVKGNCLIILSEGKTIAMIVDTTKKFIKQRLPTNTRLWFKHQSGSVEVKLKEEVLA
jgi:hypothetical protein